MNETAGEEKPRRLRRVALAAIPLLVFAGLAGAFTVQILSDRNPAEVPSALIGKAAPALDLPGLAGSDRPALKSAQIAGKLTLVNVFASWCVPCREEHPFMLELSRNPDINLVGINYKDNPDNALRFLGELGNPYASIGVDRNGAAAIDWGVYGIPETFIVGPDGTIIYKKVGPIDQQSLEKEILPVIDRTIASAPQPKN